MKARFDRGINFFDTAEIYSFGASEVDMGAALNALGVPRKDYVLSTKLLQCGMGVNDGMLSRKHIIEGQGTHLKDYNTITSIFCLLTDCRFHTT